MARTLQYVSQLLFLLVIPPLFSPENYGILAFITTSTLAFTIASSFGVNVIQYRYIPQLAAEGQDEQVRGLIRCCSKIRVGTLLPFILLWVITLTWLALDFVLIVAGAAVFSCMSINEFLFSIKYGEGGSGWYAGREAVRMVLRIPMLVGGFLVLGISGAIFTLAIVELMLIFLGLVLVRDTLTGPSEDVPVNNYLRNASLFWVNGVLGAIYAALGVYFIRVFLISYTLVGYYSLGIGLGQFITGALSSVGLALLPVFVGMGTHGKDRRIAGLVQQGVKYLAIIAPLVILWLYLLMDPIIAFMAPSFLPSSITARIALLGAFPFGLAGIFRRVIVAKDRPDIVIKARAGAFSVFVPLLILYSPMFGIFGVASAFVVGRIVEAVFLIWKASRTFALSLPTRILLVSTTTTVLLGVVLLVLVPTNILYMILGLIVASVTYIMTLILTKSTEKGDFRRLLSTILSPK